MQTIDVPDFGCLSIDHIVCDYNGTLAVDGALLPGVTENINAIEGITVHVITADTFGIAEKQLEGTDCKLSIAPKNDQAGWKREYIRALGAESVVAIGNGRNDRFMLKESAIGIALLQKEGASAETLFHADIVCASILDALEYFTNVKRIIATLRC